jgi:dihydroorotase-like cyclic amidohydrolase
MKPADLRIRNATIVNAWGIQNADIAVRDEKIVAIGDADDMPAAAAEIDANGRTVLPGLVDPHVHMGGEFPFERNCETEPISAATGGITTMLQYRLSSTASFLETFPYFRDYAANTFIVDTAFHFILSSLEQVEEIPAYVREFGIPSFKFYMGGYEPGNPIGLVSVNDAVIYRAMEFVRGLGPYAYVMVHAEDDSIVSLLTRRVEASGRNDMQAFSESRPAFCEEQDILRAIWFAELTGSPLYVPHTTVGLAVDRAAEARLRGHKVLLETCPHYLGCTWDDPHLRERGIGVGKVKPPLRDRPNQDRLWWGLAHGFIHTVGSDHVPIIKRGSDLWDERPGFAGLATLLPVLLSEGVNTGRILLEKVAEVTSFNPARTFGFYPRKGAIQIGADADLVIVDLERTQEVNAETTQSHYSSAVDGRTLRGWPVLTIRRGEVIFADGRVPDSVRPGSGRVLERAATPDPYTAQASRESAMAADRETRAADRQAAALLPNPVH